MDTDNKGNLFENGEIIIRAGDEPDYMYMILEGNAEVLQEIDDMQIILAVLGEGDVFGEMALFRKEVRSTTVRALGRMRALTLDKTSFLKRVHEDPSFAFMILQKLSRRIHDLDDELVRMKT